MRSMFIPLKFYEFSSYNVFHFVLLLRPSPHILIFCRTWFFMDLIDFPMFTGRMEMNRKTGQ